jgi:pre-mRNA-processing factor 19
VVTGGVDNQVILFDAENSKLAQKMVGHTKKVNSVLFHPTKEVILSASQDGTARVWAGSDPTNWRAAYTTAHTIRKHKAEVTDLSIHPLGDFFLTASMDKSWAIHDLMTGKCVKHMQDLTAGFQCMKFHPDGLILAGGTDDKAVQVWDIKDQVTVATLQGHEGAVQAVSFSENGYYLASASKDGSVKLWDLRKPLCIQTLQLDAPVNCVNFDKTGQYVVAGADKIHIYNFETKSQLGATIDLSDHEGAVMGVCFGQNARTVASVSMDRALKLYKIPA